MASPKLGTGGLVAAYTTAAKAAFEALETEERVRRVRFEIAVLYSLFEEARRLLDAHECLVEDEQFGAEVRLRFQIPEENVPAFTHALQDLSAGQVTPTLLAWTRILPNISYGS